MKIIKDIQAYTLIEIAVVLSIFMFLVALSGDYIINGLKSNNFIFEQDAAVQSARYSSNIMVKEIRKTAQSVTGDYLIKTPLPQEFAFFSDVNDDGSTDQVKYSLSGNFLFRTITLASGTPLGYASANAATTTLVRYVNNKSLPIFSYYDKNNSQIADPISDKASIRMIGINLKINVTPTRAPLDYFVRSYIQIRNLKDNL